MSPHVLEWELLLASESSQLPFSPQVSAGTDAAPGAPAAAAIFIELLSGKIVSECWGEDDPPPACGRVFSSLWKRFRIKF